MYTGFRFVQISGFPDRFEIKPEMLTARFAHTAVRDTSQLKFPNLNGSEYETENVLNRIHKSVRYSSLSNLWSIPTDCPQREKRGWTGDA